MSAPPVVEVPGQPEVANLLARALETGRVAHAYAFVGPSGVGRRRAALAFARALVAPAGGPAAARVDRGAHPDVHLIEPTPPESNPKGVPTVRIESIREIGRLAALRPHEAPMKVFIVDEAERMTLATPQAFLKTLEEPPPRTVIILILTQIRTLPATVLSRCQIVRFRPVPAPGMVACLPPGAGQEREQALAWLAEVEAEGVDAIVNGSEAIGRDRQLAERMVETWWLWYRDLLCASAGAASELAVFGERQAEARVRQLPVAEVLRGLAACREAWHAIQGNVSPRLTVEVLLSRLALGTT
ncbi:MAG: DNA polymerase III subunit [Candidatus Rokubacteria bacterium]|nr:DNA polymerase III subunit [Candidatus Rokubacteria bacterium]